MAHAWSALERTEAAGAPGARMQSHGHRHPLAATSTLTPERWTIPGHVRCPISVRPRHRGRLLIDPYLSVSLANVRYSALSRLESGVTPLREVPRPENRRLPFSALALEPTTKNGITGIYWRVACRLRVTVRCQDARRTATPSERSI
jgi:hypothetical protein